MATTSSALSWLSPCTSRFLKTSESSTTSTLIFLISKNLLFPKDCRRNQLNGTACLFIVSVFPRKRYPPGSRQSYTFLSICSFVLSSKYMSTFLRKTTCIFLFNGNGDIRLNFLYSTSHFNSSVTR